MMKSSAIAALLGLFTASAALAADARPQVPAAQRPGFDRISEGDLRADLGFIASDATQGRMSLQPGDDAIIAWIAAEFTKAGLKPAGTDGKGAPSFLQAVPLVEYRPSAPDNFIALTTGTGGAAVTRRFAGPDMIGGYRNDVDITAPLAFAGYGITAPGVGYDDYAGVDVRGKIVIVFEHEPQENDPRSRFGGIGNTRHATNRVKGLIAQQHGAVAVLVLAEPNRKHPSNIDRVNRIGGSAKRVPGLPTQALPDDELRIPIITISDAAALALLAPTNATPAALQAAIDANLTPHSQNVGDARLTVHLQNSIRSRGTSYNVTGLLPGSDPTLAAETIIISGHHDHDGFNGAEIWHGADDNGSGTVGVVELARAFAANPVRPKRSILFVVFAAEERGLLGAYHMAAHPLRPLATTRAQINFDMIGRDETASEQTDGLITIPADTSNRLNLIGASYSPDFNRTIMAANRSIGLDLDDRFDRDSALNIFFRSDQFPFVLHDIPAFWFFTGFHPDYHHTTDTVEKINFAKMTRILQLAYLTTWRLGTDKATPAFITDPAGQGAK